LLFLIIIKQTFFVQCIVIKQCRAFERSEFLKNGEARKSLKVTFKYYVQIEMFLSCVSVCVGSVDVDWGVFVIMSESGGEGATKKE